MFPVVRVNVPAAGSYSSAVGSGTPLPPPATNTLPVSNSVAEWPALGVFRLPLRAKPAGERASETRTVVETDAERLSASVTLSVIGNCPSLVGVPESTPVGLRLRPIVSRGVSDQVSGAAPPLAVN